MADQMSERDEVTLRLLAIVEQTNFAEQRRRALAEYAQLARHSDPDLAEAVRLCLASRRRHVNGGRNVFRLRSVSDG